MQLSRKTDDSSIPDSTSTYAYTTDLGTSNQCQGVGNATHRTTVDGPRLSTDVQDTTTYCMDKYDRVLQTVDANGHQRRATWTDNSNVETFDASGLAAGSQATYTYKYDSNDNPTDETAPNGAHASASFNDGANPNFPTSVYGFDIAGNKSSPATWAYAYDSDGNLTKARSDNSGNPVEYDYCWTNDGQLQRVDPLPIDTNTAGACTTAAQANDTLYTYNADHELQKVDPPGLNRMSVQATIVDWVPETQVLWKTKLPGFVRSLRYIEIDKLSEAGCILSNGEIFEGFGVRYMGRKYRSAAYRSFEAIGEALRARAEALWQKRS